MKKKIEPSTTIQKPIARGCLKLKKEERSRDTNWGNCFCVFILFCLVLYYCCTWVFLVWMLCIQLIIFGTCVNCSSNCGFRFWRVRHGCQQYHRVPIGVNHVSLVSLSPPQSNIEDLVSRYIVSENIGKKSMMKRSKLIKYRSRPVYCGRGGSTRNNRKEACLSPTIGKISSDYKNHGSNSRRMTRRAYASWSSKEISRTLTEKHFLCYEEARMSFPSPLALITLLFFFKELKLFEIGNIFLELDFKSLISHLAWGFKFFHFHYKEVVNRNYFKPYLGKDVRKLLKESLVLQNG
ncbi:hypothetical protein M9H77_36163 [Catharanthus roseus]|uniref:Uncharacterized protein n=1 Tax=Catharanthus roseus TaxID=4058 RepID=A0ACB9ZRU1_CATRO|nr:hypothetical protein M9H77_36163 [Catharanthus roseus]